MLFEIIFDSGVSCLLPMVFVSAEVDPRVVSGLIGAE